MSKSNVVTSATLRDKPACAMLFPGQGSQCVGMGKALFAHKSSRLVFEEVESVLGDALGAPLTSIMFEGPEDKLRLTTNAQLALMATSIACLRLMQDKGFDMQHVHLMAGHSLGEITALCASGVLSLSDTTRLLRVRSLAMQEADPKREGAMTAILGLEHDAFADMPHTEGKACVIANDNGAGQVVISGHKEAVFKATVWAKEKKARCIPLPVAGAFHSPLMTDAAKTLSRFLKTLTFHKPRVPLMMNFSATLEDDPVRIKQNIDTQMTGQILWRTSMDAMKKLGIMRFIEVGSGRVLSTLARRHMKTCETFAIATPDAIDAFLQEDA